MVSNDGGIPENMFGPVPEDFYRTVGQVVMLAAMVELRLLDLLTELDRSTQDRHAGEPTGGMINMCRDRLPLHETPFAADAGHLLDDLAAALDGRNSVVHSVWPSPGVDRAFGWRPVREARRPTPAQPYLSIEVNLTWLH